MTEPRKELRNGRYTLVRVLGEGGQAETFEAIDNGIPKSAATQARLAEKWGRYIERARAGEDRASQAAADRLENAGRLVAVKSFRVGKAKAWKDVELAEREARTLASLDHPKLPKYIEHFEEDGALYLVMEKVEGESLASLRKQRILGSDDVVRMLEDIADALRYLHGRSPLIIHRDIKPANIIRRLDGSYALVDFGAVRDRLKPAGGSTVVGTFGYMAPEQFQGRASPKSDVYGLGATAIAMLTGTEPEDLPHEGLGIDVERALPKGTPKSLVRALSSMLVPDPDRRIGSVDEALALLRLARCELARPRAKDAEPLTRKDKRTAKRERKRAAREDKARRRALARTRRPPFLPRTFAKLGLLIAMLAVWIAVGLVVPSVLVALSLLFGAALRRAAHANVRAARRAQSRLNDAWSWLSGERPESAEPPRVRVPSGLDEVQRARVVSEAEKAEPNRTEEAEFDEEFEPDRHRFRPERRR